MSSRLDHLVITAPTLQAGSDWVFDCLGVRPGKGGEHPRMGTHNLLLRVGRQMYLEVIAINPDAPAPARPRWFELDKLPGDASPRLAGWVVRTRDIHRSLAAASEPLGIDEPMDRGALRWRISMTPDGSFALGGVAPALIEWEGDSHPATGMIDQGCQLLSLELAHPQPRRVSELLKRLEFAEPDLAITVGEGTAPTLVAQLQTPWGVRTIGPAVLDDQPG